LVIARSAEAVTVVLATEVLLAGTGSAVVEDTEAVLDSDAAWFGAVTTTVIVGAVFPVGQRRAGAGDRDVAGACRPSRSRSRTRR
jgi:hypothetical protein